MPCYGLWINLPKQLVCERAAKRTQHEGGAVGGIAAGLACQTHQSIASTLSQSNRLAFRVVIKLDNFGCMSSHCIVYIWYELAENGGPTLNEGFEHVIQVNADSEVQAVLQAWQEFNPAMSTASDVLLQLNTTIRPSQLVVRADGKLSLP